ncbi:MAG: hypothetical protein ACYCTE_04530 [Acidimicrobiales bacterium]
MGDEQHLFDVYRDFSCTMSPVRTAVVRVVDILLAAAAGVGLCPSRETSCFVVAVCLGMAARS